MSPEALSSTITDQLLRRVCGEFIEMPGLQVTCGQAQRLWGLDERTCLHLLEYLMEHRFLSRRGRGLYTRLTEGHVEFPWIGQTAGI